MKRIILLFSLFAVGLSTFGQFNVGEINKSLVKINSNLYASRYEVTNGMYMTFINSLKQSRYTDLLAIAEVDPLKSQFKFYHNHPGYVSYPVINVKYDAAILFCNWLTENYNASHGRRFKKVVFRLPTEKEWMEAAQSGDTLAVYPWKGDKLRDEHGCYNCSYHVDKLLPPNSVDTYSQSHPMKTGSFRPNKYGLFEMSGNVAEMICEKGITKGGSWKNDSTFLKINSRGFFDGSGQESVGFRYFAEIIEY